MKSFLLVAIYLIAVHHYEAHSDPLPEKDGQKKQTDSQVEVTEPNSTNHIRSVFNFWRSKEPSQSPTLADNEPEPNENEKPPVEEQQLESDELTGQI